MRLIENFVFALFEYEPQKERIVEVVSRQPDEHNAWVVGNKERAPKHSKSIETEITPPSFRYLMLVATNNRRSWGRLRNSCPLNIPHPLLPPSLPPSLMMHARPIMPMLYGLDPL